MNVADDKTIVREYFNSTGFDRWRRIYGDGEVNKVQLDIRTGHQQTVATVLSWLRADENLGISVCDAGCGVGSLSIPWCAGKVYASDISEKMVGEAQDKAEAVLVTLLILPCRAGFETLWLLPHHHHLPGCLNPPSTGQGSPDDFSPSSMAESRLIISFAPKPWLLVLKKIGSSFREPVKRLAPISTGKRM